MNPTKIVLALCALSLCSASALAQHAQVSAVAVQPGNPNRVWVANRDNDSVAVIDVVTSLVVAEIQVGVFPRSLCFNATGTKVFVANQRGNVPLDATSVAGYPVGAQFGTVSVIDVGSLAVQSTITGVGVEPYGVALAPNGKWFAVSGTRSGSVRFYDAATLTQVAAHQYLNNPNEIPTPFTMADVDSNRDGIADTGDPRGFTIRADSTRLYVTHLKSPFVSVLNLTLNGLGFPTSVTMSAKIDTNEYPFDPFFNPTPVQTIASQGVPRFLEDVALSPDGTKALVPHVLHNINHDVNHNFGPTLAGDFANRVYPALTQIDAASNTYAQPGDNSRRLHHELSDTLTPAEYVPFGNSRVTSLGDRISLGGIGSPVMGGSAQLRVGGLQPGDSVVLLVGQRETNLPFGSAGTLYVSPRATLAFSGTTASFPIANLPQYQGLVIVAQALVTRPGGEQALSNGVRVVINPTGFGANNLGYRAGQPSRVAYNPAGDRVLMLNRASEDLFLFKATGSSLELVNVFPPRFHFVERAGLDTTSPMGDVPLGMTLRADPTTINDDALVYVINEGTRTLSVLRVDWATGQISKEKSQISTISSPDAFTLSERVGQELFEDASRAVTAGNFNNSCGSCHFEGGEDSNVWQRPAGPRSTMPMYGGGQATGLILWKGVRLNSGETGPMFGGENGGTGIFDDAEQQSLIDFHAKLPVPLNPNRNLSTGGLTAQAQLGQDLFFQTNETGLNPTLRHGGCATCHPREETNPFSNPGPRFFTSDFVNPTLANGETLATFDVDCFALRENLVGLNIRNVNTAVNGDSDGDGFPEVDRNSDGFPDLETYLPMNTDKEDDFQRDDPNGYNCPCDPSFETNCSPVTNTRIFTRRLDLFSVPTKLGVFSTGPYFHDHSASSLRTLLDPEAQALSPVYGNLAFPGQTPYPGLQKIFNEVHDVRGHEQFVQGASKVQVTLQSTNANADLSALLAFITSL